MIAIALAALIIIAALFPQWSFAETTSETAHDALIDKLVEKGVISSHEAKELAPDMKKEKQKAPFNMNVRAQARFDFGDLLINDNETYETESDLYMRRARLEIEKKFETPPFGKELELSITFDADRAGQDFDDSEREDPSSDVELRYLYADWTFADEFALKVGKHKLPFSRVSLTSSSRQLLIERPVSTETAKDGLGDYQQPQLQVHGYLRGGTIGYYLAFSDGVNNLDELQDLDNDADEVRNEAWGNAYIARLELSPVPEKKKDDTGIGDKNHVTLGLNAGTQNNVKYATSAVSSAAVDTWVMGADIAARYSIGAGILTGQAEYVKFRKNFAYKENETPKGRYAQLGYLLPGMILKGRLEPAVRYESFQQGRILNAGVGKTHDERIYTAGFNHYLSEHNVKWSYNWVSTRFDAGVAETVNDRTRKIHQILLQFYF